MLLLGIESADEMSVWVSGRPAEHSNSSRSSTRSADLTVGSLADCMIVHQFLYTN